jgi:ubiquinone/menaquinone biosynthesis C-methylase UbiE
MGDALNPFVQSAVAAEYDAWFTTPMGRVVDTLEKRLIMRLAWPVAGERALDVGTGTGHYACELAWRGLQVTGLDPSVSMLQIAGAKSSSVTWQDGSAASLPYAEGSFDLVLSVTALEFMPDPIQAVSEMMGVLRPGGRLVVAVLNRASPWGRAYIAESQQVETPYSHAHFYEPREFAALLAQRGRPTWSSAVFFAPSGRGMWAAGALECLGHVCCRGRGALLVGRIDK